MSKGKVVVAGSNATRIEIQGGGTGPTGQYLNETVVPAMALVEEGYDVVLATPDGSKPHIDPVSDVAQHFGGDQAAYKRGRAFFDTHPAMVNVRTLRSIVDEGLDNYAGVFVPGGQAPIVDLMQDPDLGEILRHFHERGKPTALLCHGPIADAVGAAAGESLSRCADRAGPRQGVRPGKGLALCRLQDDGVLGQRRDTDRGADSPRQAVFQHAGCARSGRRHRRNGPRLRPPRDRGP